MAKTKTKSRSNSKDILRSTNTPLVKSTVSKSQRPLEELLSEASELLEKSQPEQAWPLAQEALRRLEADKSAYANVDTMLQSAAQEKPTFPVALVLGADISLALGDVDKARAQYELAVKIDPNGALVSAEPYLELAQLCEEGGSKSIEYFDKAIEVMRNELDVLDDEDAVAVEEMREIIDIRRSKVADALCAMAEVYMTDLSWEVDAEQRSDQLVTEAVAICPEAFSAGVLQTLASVRISQERVEEARKVLAQSLALWKDIPAGMEHPSRPDFATRVSLVRLLMEVEDEQHAIPVLEGLIKDDDQSVEAWYLGGWCHVLLSKKPQIEEEVKIKETTQAREWLATCLRLFRIQQYEDEPLRQHAEELLRELNKSLNLPHGDNEWEDTDEDDKDDDLDEEDVEIDANDVGRQDDEDVEMT